MTRAISTRSAKATRLASIFLTLLLATVIVVACSNGDSDAGTATSADDDAPTPTPSGDDDHSSDDDTPDDDTPDDDTPDDDHPADDDTHEDPAPANCDTAGLPLDQLSLPDGFHICVYAKVPSARSMAVGPKGTLFVGTRADSVYAVEDKNGDKTGDAVHVIADGLVQPNGVEVHDGDLYVGEIFRITRYDDIEDHLDDPGEPAIVNDTYPTDTHHGWKFIKFGPDGKLYIPVGAPCNVCEKKDERFATITRVDADGKNFEIYSRGIRNTVGFDWHPKTGKLWFTDNGRDMLGDDIPPDELNSAPEPGMHFGFPYCHGGTIDDPVFGEARTCAEFTKPKHNFHAHVAALGMRFYDGDQFPGDYTNQIFVCQHGSWNRSEKIGYRVMLVNVDEAGETVTKAAPFIEGWLQGESVWGRPVDVQVMPDGALMVSDDRAGVVYRVYYKK